MYPVARSRRVLVAGTTARDTVLRVPELPEPDTAVRAERVEDVPGGCGANAAYALARLGHAPELLTAVGEGFAGSSAEQRLTEAGVSLAHAVRDRERATARAVVTTDATDRQTIVYHEGATPAMTRLEPLETDFAHFAPGELSAYPRLMQACGTVTYDPGQETFYRPIEEVTAPIEHADVLLVNEHEAERLASAYGGMGALVGEVEALVVSDREGQTIHTEGGRQRVPGVEAEAVDPTGAGDAHGAGVLHGLAEGWSLAEACRLGSVLAARAVESLGAQEGLPTLGAARVRYEAAYGAWPGE